MSGGSGEPTGVGILSLSSPRTALLVVLVLTTLVCLHGLHVVQRNRLPQIGGADSGDLRMTVRVDAALRSPEPGALLDVVRESRDRVPFHPLAVATSGLAGERLTRTSFWAWNAGFLLLTVGLVFWWGRESGTRGSLAASLVLLASPMTVGLLPRPGMELILGGLLAALAVLVRGQPGGLVGRYCGRTVLAGLVLATGGLFRWTFFVYVVPLLVLEVAERWREAGAPGRPGSPDPISGLRKAWAAARGPLVVTTIGGAPFAIWLLLFGDLPSVVALAGSEPTPGTLDAPGALKWLGSTLWTYYLRPWALPTLVLAAAGAALALSARRGPTPGQRQALAVALGVVGSHLLAAHKEVRYLYVALPALAILVSAGLTAFGGTSRPRRLLAWVSVLAWCLLATPLWTIAQHQEDMLNDYHVREPVLAPIDEDLGLAAFLTEVAGAADGDPVGLDLRVDLDRWMEAALWIDAPVPIRAWHENRQPSPRAPPAVFISGSPSFQTGDWKRRASMDVPLPGQAPERRTVVLWVRRPAGP